MKSWETRYRRALLKVPGEACRITRTGRSGETEGTGPVRVGLKRERGGRKSGRRRLTGKDKRWKAVGDKGGEGP